MRAFTQVKSVVLKLVFKEKVCFKKKCVQKMCKRFLIIVSRKKFVLKKKCVEKMCKRFLYINNILNLFCTKISTKNVNLCKKGKNGLN